MKKLLRNRCTWVILAGLAVGVFIFILSGNRSGPKGPRSLPRSELDLRDGMLYARGETQPFQGQLVAHYSDQTRKVAIDVKDGRLHGRSLGWYSNGQMEVEEQFVAGVSHGARTRWHENGNRKSLAQIEQGKVVGLFTEWHENGQKAVEMTLRDGQPDGIVEAWHSNGELKSRLRYENGAQVEKLVWENPPRAMRVAAGVQ